VDAATLMKKLVRSGKYDELWSQKTNNNQNQKQKNNNNNVKDDKNKGKKQGLVKGLEVFKNQQKFPASSSEEDDEYYEYDEDEEEEDEEMRFIREKANHFQMLKQATDANNVKKGIIAKTNNADNGNSGKKGNPNHNMVMKEGANEIDQKTMAAMKLNNAHLVGNESLNLGESKWASDIGAMMNLAGFNGNNNNGANSATVLGGNSNGNGGFPTGSTAYIPNGSFVTGQYPSSMLMNMNGFNNHPSSLMNMQARHAMQQHPQMMYHR